VIQNNSLIWPMKHYIKKCKKDSWRIQNVKYNNLHRFAQKCSKIYKNAHKYVKIYSIIVIIKTMSLLINFGHFLNSSCMMVGGHLVMLYSRTNYKSHKLVLCNSTQPKSKFTQFVKSDFKILIEQLNLK
jgi:hypothetical protein